MNEEIKTNIDNWVSRVLQSGTNATPEELEILPKMVGFALLDEDDEAY